MADAQHLVRGYFDAQNGFGAMIRSQYSCQVKNTGGSKYTLVDLKIE